MAFDTVQVPFRKCHLFFCKALRVALSTLPNKDSAVIQRTTNDALNEAALGGCQGSTVKV